MTNLVKVLFILGAIAGIVAVFFVSWFWRLLLVPMIILVVLDLARDFLKKDK